MGRGQKTLAFGLVVILAGRGPIEASVPGCCAETQLAPPPGLSLRSNSVAVHGDRAVVGSRDGQFAAVYRRENGTWRLEAVLRPSRANTVVSFGDWVDMWEGTIVVTDQSETVNGIQHAGAIYVFELIDGAWQETAKLTVSGPHERQHLESVAVRGGTIVGGASNTTDPRSGAIRAGAGFIFVKPEGAARWSDMNETAVLRPRVARAEERFGISCAIDGSTVVLGGDASGTGRPGHVYVFHQPAGGWVGEAFEDQELALQGGTPGNRLGLRVAVEGDVLAATAPFEDVGAADTGLAVVYRRAGGTWSEVARLTPNQVLPDERFGRDVAVARGRIAVGSSRGRFFLFEAPPGGWADVDSPPCSPTGIAPGSQEDITVALDDRTLLVGARFSDGAFAYPNPSAGIQGFTFSHFNPQGYAEYVHDSTGMLFVRLPGGTFQMGSPDEECERELSEGPLHEVTLSPFLIAKYEVSQAEWRCVMGTSPSLVVGDDLPVESVSWDDIQVFEARTGLTLPSEAQWEYACRAGTATPFAFGNCLSTDQANHDGRAYCNCPGGQGRGTTVAVDSFSPNGFGIHNMHGNVWEWCEDLYDAGFYAKPEASGPDPVSTSSSNPPAGPTSRVVRGGTYVRQAGRSRSADRNWDPASRRFYPTGFRAAALLPPNQPPAAIVGPDQAVNEGDLVTLDGSASQDPNGDALSYAWEQVSGSAVVLDVSDPVHPTFVAPFVAAGGATLTFTLRVSDGALESDPDVVNVTVKNLNHAPVADAGLARNVPELSLVTLDGSGGFDPDADEISFSWVQVAAPGDPVVALAGAETPAPSFTAPEVGPEGLTLVFQLTVTDHCLIEGVDPCGLSATSTVEVHIQYVNQCPAASAGLDLQAIEGAVVALDGSESFDPDGNPLAFAWLAPSGIALDLTDPQRPVLVAPAVACGSGAFEITLTVDDGFGCTASDALTLNVENVNSPPIANAAASPPQVPEGELVTLSASGSSDPDGEVIDLLWAQVGEPAVALSDAASVSPTFTAPLLDIGGSPVESLTLTFDLVVTDACAGQGVDSVTVVVTNTPHDPVAAAGDNRAANEGAAVALDGSGSFDPDGDALTFTWVQVAGPAVFLSGGDTAAPAFAAPFVGSGGAILELELTVADPFGGSSADTVQVTVANVNDPPVCGGAQASAQVLWPPNHKLLPVQILGVADPDGNATVTITGVTQDEPTNGL
ncbi:MAG: SUMF1/EgtB/PvdO family nonheme iron enzyme, partial [Planctomycetes bacterium]|nr:SUMF1/EgtB/PvdO family nonheme iron enzyme [Planctomycetota bacterium]